MRRFKIFSTRTGEHCGDGVQFPNGSLAQCIDNQLIPTPANMAGFYMKTLPALEFRVEWLD